MKCSKRTEVGKVRKNNEDYLGAWEDLGLFVVADGMGGHQAGEVASQIAVDTLLEFFQREGKLYSREPIKLLEKAIIKANEIIYLKAQQHKELRGMGTTITACFLIDNQLTIGHVGDSRAYRINPEGIQQLTEDHSLVNELLRSGGITKEEAVNHPQKNVLTRALGVDLKIDPDFYSYELTKGEYLLLCTDGLSGLVPKEAIMKVSNSGTSLEEKVDLLVKLALDRGGNDNISVILVEVD